MIADETPSSSKVPPRSSLSHDHHDIPPEQRPHPPRKPTLRNDFVQLSLAQDDASNIRVWIQTSIIGGGIALVLIAMLVTLPAYLCISHHCERKGMALLSTAPLGKVLTIALIISHIPPVAIPIVMVLFSNSIAVKWLLSSQDSGINRPTPLQLGLILYMCSSATISALVTTLQYSFGSARRRKTSPSPPILRQSTILLFLLFLLAYITIALDSWLHASSSAASILHISPYTAETRNFGRALNLTRCNPDLYPSGSIARDTCGLVSAAGVVDVQARMEGIRLQANGSSLHRVEFTDDQTAIVVPQRLPTTLTYTARTIGLKSTCKSITEVCLRPETRSNGQIWYGPLSTLALDCRAGGTRVNGSTLGPKSSWDVQPSNPFQFGEIIVSESYYDDSRYDNFLPNTGWFVHGDSTAYNVVNCNSSALEVEYEFSQSKYTIRSTTPLLLESTRAIVAGSKASPIRVPTTIDGVGLQNGTTVTYEEAYALELSRQIMARAGFVYAASDALSVDDENQIVGTQIGVIPLALFMTIIFLFVCLVITVSMLVIIDSWGIPYVHLAALRFNDPLTIIQALYGHRSAILTWEKMALDTFGQESEGDRLYVGPLGLRQGGSAFVVSRP